MADALLVEIGGITAGIAVKDREGLRFFASDPMFYGLDGTVFGSIGQVHAAVRGLRLSSAPSKRMNRLPTAA